ncbi:hypothetical protein [Candidatus Berkiella aquae]|uniref:Lipoprotein n=1 Tax=Candidatus Berkiella aquae TaxID=295108 RepID=A0A0Q9YNJ1_9GAMM|nr:hypothetical protein [Candidatus Berkiella aquae]MCS5712451.1 hypothetical protein [Candidatus Berkiella aquae]
MKKAARLIALTGMVFLVGCESLSPPQIDPAIIESNEMDKALLVNRYHNVHYLNRGFYPNSTYQRSGSFYYQRGYRY